MKSINFLWSCSEGTWVQLSTLNQSLKEFQHNSRFQKCFFWLLTVVTVLLEALFYSHKEELTALQILNIFLLQQIILGAVKQSHLDLIHQ